MSYGGSPVHGYPIPGKDLWALMAIWYSWGTLKRIFNARYGTLPKANQRMLLVRLYPFFVHYVSWTRMVSLRFTDGSPPPPTPAAQRNKTIKRDSLRKTGWDFFFHSILHCFALSTMRRQLSRIAVFLQADVRLIYPVGLRLPPLQEARCG